ncbi:MAG: hypothetical protein QXF82_10625 [Nitrososphaeria archaeon]
MIKHEVDKGFKNPTNRSKLFNNKPINIKNARLNPVESDTISAILNFSIFKIFMIRRPGTKVR